MKKLLSVLHCSPRSNKNNRSLKKEVAMPDSEHALLKEAFQHAEYCLTEANAIVDYLDQAIADLQEEEPELREAVTQSLIKADQFIDHCGAIVHDLLELRLKYRAAHSTSGLPPEVEALTETLARIELRRRSGRRPQV
jgi:glutathione S-transferase